VDSGPWLRGRPSQRPQGPLAILLVLLLKAIWALLETPCFAQLAAQLFLVGLLHGFNGWEQGRKMFERHWPSSETQLIQVNIAPGSSVQSTLHQGSRAVQAVS
jgi:hypothetical protein